MTWFKVDDTLAFHHKTVAAGVPALGLWVRAGSWCAQTLTDGFVPEHMVSALADGDVGLARRLVEAGLWCRVKGGYAFHGWVDYQPSRQSIEDRRAVRAAAGRNGGVRSGQVRRAKRSNTEARASSTTDANASRLLEPPTRPDPSSSSAHLEWGVQGGDAPQGPPRKRGSPSRATRIPEDFAITAEMLAWARQHAPGVDGRFETAQFCDYWRAKSGRDATKLDWVATWRNWMRNAAKRAPHRNGHRSGTDENIRRLLAGTTAEHHNVIALPGGGT